MGWTISYKSFKGYDCRVDINGGGTAVVGTVDPVVIEEESDESLLSVVRSKSGYLNLVERTAHELDDLIPTSVTSHRVRVYYNNNLVFTGFMQPQTFASKYEPAPRTLSFPIVSPLGIAESFDLTEINPPEAVTLASLLADVVGKLRTAGADYLYVYWPKLSVGLDSTISSLVACPFNNDHSPAPVSPGLFEPKDCMWFLTNLCNAFGWILHETAHELIFSMYDHDGDYYTCSVTNLATLTNVSETTFDGDDTFALGDYLTPADSHGNTTRVMPVKTVEFSYDGEYNKTSAFQFDHLTYNTYQKENNLYIAWLRSYTPELTGSALDFMNVFDGTGKLVNEAVTAVSCGTYSDQKECILINLPNSTIHTGELFTLKFYERPTGDSFKISYSMRWADIPLYLDSDSNVPHKHLAYIVKIGDQYYQGGGVWGSTRPNPSVFQYAIENVPDGFPVEIIFSETQADANAVRLLAMDSIQLEEPDGLYSDYRVYHGDTDKHGTAGGTGIGTATVDQAFTCYRKNSNMIGTTALDFNSKFTTYPYLREPRTRLQLCFKIDQMLSYQAYLKYATFDSESWRIISMKLDTWNDEVELTMQHQ